MRLMPANAKKMNNACSVGLMFSRFFLNFASGGLDIAARSLDRVARAQRERRYRHESEKYFLPHGISLQPS
jgi:hypothetical protein